MDAGVITVMGDGFFRRWRALEMPRLSIRSWLILSGVAVVVPMLGFTGWLLWAQWSMLEAEERQQLRQRAEVVAQAVENRLTLSRVVLQTLADSEAARRNDIERLRLLADLALAHQGDALSIDLARPDGALVFSTPQTWGRTLQPPVPLAEPLDDEAWFRSGEPKVSPLFRSALSGDWAVRVAVPVRSEGQVPHALRMQLPAQALQAVLNDPGSTDRWLGAIVDGRHRVVARSSTAGVMVGDAVPDELLLQVRNGNTDHFQTRQPDGVVALNVLRPIAGTDWHLVLSRSVADIELARQRTLLHTLGLGSLGLLLGALASLAIVIGVSAQVRRLPDLIESTSPAQLREDVPPTSAAATAALAATGPVPERRRPRSSPVREVEQVVEQLSGLQQLQQQLVQRLQVAQLDPLTELPSRRLFLDTSAALLRSCWQSSDTVLAVFYLDLDGFKQVNDRFGHPAGDKVLCQVGALLRTCARQGDMAGRLGGDEFVLSMALDRRHAEATCRAVAQRLINGTAALGQGLGCSVGVALATDPAEAIDQLIARADVAMLQVKRRGKNHYAFAEPAPSPPPPGATPSPPSSPPAGPRA
jgi:diguanylate cyclase (GGDEF)-like protein